jgi:hypothetical protein
MGANVAVWAIPDLNLLLHAAHKPVVQASCGCKHHVILSAAIRIMANAQEGQQDFTLVITTGFDLSDVYVSPGKSSNWEEDVMGDDKLEDGESQHIRFHRTEKTESGVSRSNMPMIIPRWCRATSTSARFRQSPFATIARQVTCRRSSIDADHAQ